MNSYAKLYVEKEVVLEDKSGCSHCDPSSPPAPRGRSPPHQLI